MEEIHLKDQALRKMIVSDGCIETTFGKNSKEMIYFWILMEQEDKKLSNQVVKIIEEHGWLGISEVGDTANNAIFLVIQHADTDIQEKYFPLLKTSAEKGESKLSSMALMDDRIRIRRGKKQLYGSQTLSINGKVYVYPIEDPEHVDERRANVNLQPLEDYLEIFGSSYPQDELPENFSHTK